MSINVVYCRLKSMLFARVWFWIYDQSQKLMSTSLDWKLSLFYNYLNLKSWVSKNVYGFKYRLPLEILTFQNSTTRMLTWEKWSSWSWNWQRMQKWMRRCVIFVPCSKGVVKALESKIRKIFRLDLPGLVWQSYL